MGEVLLNIRETVNQNGLLYRELPDHVEGKGGE